MRIIDLEQGSPEWLAWRKTVITATDASCILGSNPWTTPYKCWQRKLGLIEEKESNEAMERGKRLEPEAREQFINRYGIGMQPAIVESLKYEFLGASLDGISHDRTLLLEIKCGGAKLHDMAKRGEIPDYYKHQMQHQLFVTGAKKCFYYSYDGSDGICIEVLPDEAFVEQYLPKAREFWRCVAFNEPPPMQDKDYKDMSDNPLWNICAAEYKAICKEEEIIKEKKEKSRTELLELCGDQSCHGGGIKCMKTLVKGRVDYDAIPELKDLDLDKYRKEAKTVWKICG